MPGDPTGPQASTGPKPKPLPAWPAGSPWVWFPVACPQVSADTSPKLRTHAPPRNITAAHRSRCPAPAPPAAPSLQLQHPRTRVPAWSAVPGAACHLNSTAWAQPPPQLPVSGTQASQESCSIALKAPRLTLRPNPSLNVISKHCPPYSPFCLLSFQVCEFPLIQIKCETRVCASGGLRGVGVRKWLLGAGHSSWHGISSPVGLGAGGPWGVLSTSSQEGVPHSLTTCVLSNTPDLCQAGGPPVGRWGPQR